MYRADKILLCTGWCYVHAESALRLKGQLFYRCFQLVRTRHGPRAEPIVRVCRSTRQTFGFSRQTRAFMTQSRRSKSLPSLSLSR